MQACWLKYDDSQGSMRRRPHEAKPTTATTVNVTFDDFFMENTPYFGVKVESTPNRL